MGLPFQDEEVEIWFCILYYGRGVTQSRSMLFVGSLTSKSCGIVMLHCCQVQHFVLKKRAKKKRGKQCCVFMALVQHGPVPSVLDVVFPPSARSLIGCPWCVFCPNCLLFSVFVLPTVGFRQESRRNQKASCQHQWAEKELYGVGTRTTA